MLVWRWAQEWVMSYMKETLLRPLFLLPAGYRNLLPRGLLLHYGWDWIFCGDT